MRLRYGMSCVYFSILVMNWTKTSVPSLPNAKLVSIEVHSSHDAKTRRTALLMKKLLCSAP